MRRSVLAVLLTCWLVPALQATDRPDLQNHLADVRAARAELQRHTASFLVVVKQMGVAEQGEERRVRIVQARAPVRSADQVTAPLVAEAREGEVYPLRARSGDWFQVTLPSGQAGWVPTSAAQQVAERVTRAAGGNSGLDDPRIREVAEALYERVTTQAEYAEDLLGDFEAAYANLSDRERQQVSDLYATFLDERKQIRTYAAYARHYHERLGPAPQQQVPSLASVPVRFEGVVSARFGTSSFTSAAEQSTRARNVSLAGSVIFSPRSRLSLNVNHDNNVVQTPYTSNDLRVGYHHRLAGGTELQGSVRYQTYDDPLFDRNTFQTVGGGVRVQHPVNASLQLHGTVDAESKTYDVEGGNAFEGTRFTSGLDYATGDMEAAVGLRGRVQSSEVSFLDYRRVIPHARLKWLTQTGHVALHGEVERLSYAEEAEGNSFTRQRANLVWARRSTTRRLTVIGKQFPNNEAFDNLRLRLRNTWTDTQGTRSGRVALSLQYVYHPQQPAQLSDYLDLRFDSQRSTRRTYFDLNLFGRYWQEAERNHRVDMFSRFGFKFGGVEVGPAVGAQLLLDPDEPEVERDGNSFRIGVDSRVHAVIRSATVYGSARYQQSVVYNSEISIDTSTGQVTEGALQTRNPTTVQVRAGLQMPLRHALDLKIDARYYNVDLDISDAISINPVEQRKGLRLLVGLSYRFRQ